MQQPAPSDRRVLRRNGAYSVGVTLPAAVVDALKLQVGDEVEVHVDGDSVRITKVQEAKGGL